MMKKRAYNVGSQSIADRIEEGSEGVEIGVWRGDTTAKFAEKAKLVHAVDSWDVSVFDDFDKICDKYSTMYNIEPTREGFAVFYDGVYNSVVDRFADSNVQVYRMSSGDWFDQNTKTDYDWVYVDGDHTYDGCMADLRSSWKIIREGGVLYGDDINAKHEVRSAVKQFAQETRKKLVELGQNQWMIKK